MKDKMTKRKVSKVDVTNDEEMISLGLRLKPQKRRDLSVWTKTPKEKKELNRIKHSSLISSNWMPPVYSVDFPGKLVVYMSGFPKMSKAEWVNNCPHSTVSYKCKLSDVDPILRRIKSSRLKISKYEWNGKTYKYGEVPVRINRGGRVSK